MEPPGPTATVVVTGVAGSGKTTVGRLLATALGWPFADGDDFHDAPGIAAMTAGIPLSDGDRIPWLDRIGAWIDAQRSRGAAAVVTCSALRRAYRERLRANRPWVRFVYLHVEQATIERRLAARRGHFFRAEMLGSQFAIVEPPGPEEDAVVVAVADDAAPEEIAAAVAARLGLAVRPS